jgi:hypothetical protein
MNINVLLSGRLRIDGYGKGMPENSDSTYRLNLQRGSTVRDVIKGFDIPVDKVTMTMLNARQCDVSAPVKSEDRVILIPSDVALLWRHLGLMNLGAESVFDFGDNDEGGEFIRCS